MSEYINENSEIFDDTPKKSPLIVRILKWICIGIIFLICATLFVRCVASRDHEIVKKVLMDDAFYEAYEKNPNELTVEQYGMQSPWVAIRDGRLIEFNNLYYIPLLKQLQFSVKYNEDLPMCEYSEMPFRFKLIDENGAEYEKYRFEEAKKFRYNYIRVCFDDIEFLTGEIDENGLEARHTYTLEIEMTDGNGSYNELCTYKIYDGKSVSKNIEYKVEK